MTLVEMSISAHYGSCSRIGMQQDPQGDFAHPKLPGDHRLSRHLLYRIRRSQWERLSTV